MASKPGEADSRLTDYLLGRLPPDEASQIEERYLSDPAFHDEVRAAERELIDQYVRGEVADPGELERRFRSSPRRQQRLAFARALSQSLSGTAAERARAAGLDPIARASSWRRLFGARPLLWQAAAAVVVLVVGVWLLAGDEPGQAPTQPRAPTSETARDPEPRAPGGVTPSPPAPIAPVRVATLVLAPSLTRGSDEMPTLRLDEQTDVRLELQLDATDYVRFQARIRTADGKDITRQEPLPLTSTPAGPAIVVTLSASLLDAGDYTIRLAGIVPGGAVEEVAGYAFRVRRQ